jgi:hypothetical protein
MVKHFLLSLALLSGAAHAQYAPTIPASGVTFNPPELVMPPNKHYVDLSTLPKPNLGYGDARVRISCGPLVTDNPANECAASTYPTHNDYAPNPPRGGFRTNCRMSHWSFDDPIVWPRQTGMTHLHQFFGNTTTDAQSDPGRMDEFGTSTCQGGILNRTGYWIPVPIVVCPEDEVGCVKSRHGKVYPAFQNIAYYKNESQGHATGGTKWLPKGFRMIAGDASNVDPARMAGWYDCFGPNTLHPNGVGNRYNRFPSAQENWDSRINTADPTPACGIIRITVHFPQPLCRIADESILYLPTPTGGIYSGHIKQGVWDVGCPDPAFPHIGPDISYNIDTMIEFPEDYDYIMLSSDPPPQRGVTRAGSTTTSVILADNERTLTDVYKDGWLTIDGQRKRIAAYNGTTKTVTLESALSSAPATGTAYIVRQPGGRSLHGDWANGWDTNPNIFGWGRSITDQIIRACWYDVDRYPDPAIFSLGFDCKVSLIGEPGPPGSAEPRIGATYYTLF